MVYSHFPRYDDHVTCFMSFLFSVMFVLSLFSLRLHTVPPLLLLQYTQSQMYRSLGSFLFPFVRIPFYMSRLRAVLALFICLLSRMGQEAVYVYDIAYDES